MVIILTALLAGKAVLPQIDRNALELQARAEALQPRATPARPIRRPAPRRATAGAPLDLASITTICRAAGSQADPARLHRPADRRLFAFRRRQQLAPGELRRLPGRQGRRAPHARLKGLYV